MNNLKSYTEYAVTTPTTDFVIGFDFNYGTDAVNVTVDGVPATEVGYSVIYLNSTTMRLSPAVPTGVVRLQRETDIDVPDNQFTAGAKFIASNMDENFTQIRHAQQEVRDGFGKLSEDTYEIIDTLQVVGQAAQDAADAAEQAAQTANDAAAQVNDKVSYQDLDTAVDTAVQNTVAEGLPATAIKDSSGKDQQEINDSINHRGVTENISPSVDYTVFLQAVLDSMRDGMTLDLLGKTYKISKGVSHGAYPNNDQPCLTVYQKKNVTIKNGKLIVSDHGLGAMEFKDSPDWTLDNVVIAGAGNFPPIEGLTGRAEKGSNSAGWWFTNNSSPLNNSVDTSGYSTGGWGGNFPQWGGGTANTWGMWNGGYLCNYGHGVRAQNSDGRLLGCDIYGFNGSALKADNSNVHASEWNKLHDNYTSGIEIGANNTTRQPNLVDVTQNYIYNNGHPDASVDHETIDPGYGVCANNGNFPVRNYNVYGNVIRGNKRKAIDSHSCINAKVYTNDCRNSAFGIDIAVASGTVIASVNIFDNHVEDIENGWSGGSHTRGIMVYNQSTYLDNNQSSFNVHDNTLRNVGFSEDTLTRNPAINLDRNAAIEVAIAEYANVHDNTIINDKSYAYHGIANGLQSVNACDSSTIHDNKIYGRFVRGILSIDNEGKGREASINGNIIKLSALPKFTSIAQECVRTHLNATIGKNSLKVGQGATSLLYAPNTLSNTGLSCKLRITITSGVPSIEMINSAGIDTAPTVGATNNALNIEFAAKYPTVKSIIAVPSFVREVLTDISANDITYGYSGTTAVVRLLYKDNSIVSPATASTASRAMNIADVRTGVIIVDVML